MAPRAWLKMGATTDKKEELQVVDGGSALSHIVPSSSPLNICMVLGSARIGKSWLMNFLMRSEGEFEVSASTVPCTAGVEVSGTVMTHQQFMGTTARQSSPAQPLISLVDVEGQGVNHPGYEIKLATPILLVAKACLYNWKGMPNMATMLAHLNVLHHAVTVVQRKSRKGMFGHLVIVLRDCGAPESECYDQIFAAEDEEEAPTDEAAKAMKDRNGIRETVLSAFSSVSVTCLPSPHSECIDRVIKLTETTPEFQTALAGLRVKLGPMLAEPSVFGGSTLSAALLKSIMPVVVQAVNEGAKDISPPSMMEAIQGNIIAAAKKDAEQLLDRLLDEPATGLSKTTALSSSHVDAALSDISSKVTTFFSAQTEPITEAYPGASTLADAAFAALYDHIDTRSEAVRSAHTALRTELDTSLRTVRECFVESFAADLEGSAQLPQPAAALDAHIKTLLVSTAAMLREQAVALAPEPQLQLELPTFAAIADAAAFAELPAVKRACTQLRAANAQAGKLQQEQEKLKAADVAATQAKQQATQAQSDLAEARARAAQDWAERQQAQQEHAEQLADVQRERDDAVRNAAAAAQQQQYGQQQQWASQGRSVYGDSSAGSCSTGSDDEEYPQPRQQRSRGASRSSASSSSYNTAASPELFPTERKNVYVDASGRHYKSDGTPHMSYKENRDTLIDENGVQRNIDNSVSQKPGRKSKK